MKSTPLFFVFIGSISYGMPAPLMKLANIPGGQTGGVIFFVFVFSAILLNGLMLIRKNKKTHLHRKELLKTISSGIPLALTTSLYFISLNYISVSVAVVMLMQSVWITQLIDWLVFRKKIPLQNGISSILIFPGTILATNMFSNQQTVSLTGLIFESPRV
ncbi:EamA family transporter [Kosakonia sp. AX9b]